MGSIYPYSTAAGKRYYVVYRKPDRSQTTKRGFETKREAQLFLASTELRIASGQWIDVRSAKVSIGSLGRDWLASQTHLKPSSLHVLQVAWRVHVEPVWGSRAVGEIRHSEVQDWVAQLSSQKSAAVVLRAYGVLAGVVDRAVKDRRLETNPVRGVNLPRKRSKPRHYLSHRQVRLLAVESRAHGTLVLLLAYTGLRWGEAVALRVGAVDLDRRRLLVSANAVNVAGRIVAGTPKGHVSRSVPIPAFLVDDLRRLCEARTADALVFGTGGAFLPTPTHGDGWFAGARTRARRADPTIPSNLAIHDLRHTAASLAISAGANVKAVQRMLGHASAAMTLDTYADLFDDDLDAVAAALDQAKHASDVVDLLSQPPEGSAPDERDPHDPGLLGL